MITKSTSEAWIYDTKYVNGQINRICLKIYTYIFLKLSHDGSVIPNLLKDQNITSIETKWYFKQIYGQANISGYKVASFLIKKKKKKQI